MYETAVFGYIVAILMAAATVATAFTNTVTGHFDIGAQVAVIGTVVVVVLWSMSNWIKKENV